MSDRLTLSRAIEDAGIERAKAERVASAIVDLIHDEVATKADPKEVRAEIALLRAELKSDIAGLRTELKADIAGLRTELKAEIAALRSELVVMEYRILSRLGALMVVLFGLLFAALHYFPPAGHG
jgi:hypothetical protein